jgi:malonyl CoA-acyl carrier protein transacylase
MGLDPQVTAGVQAELVKASGLPAIVSVLAMATPDLLHLATVIGAYMASFVAQWWNLQQTDRANRLRLELEQLVDACEQRRQELDRLDAPSPGLDGQN